MAQSGSGGRSVGLFAVGAGVLGLACLGGTAVAGVLVAIAVPNFVAMQLKAKRAEVPGNVDGIKTALLAYDAAFDEFKYCGDERSARRAVGKEQRPWVEDPCWMELGWRPDGDVRGGYWIERVPGRDGSPSFAVHGVADVDGDGVVVEYIATEWANATIAEGERNVY